MDKLKGLRSFSIFLMAYALFVILWGAWVRISGSGDGCGEHWPLCQGQWIPTGSFGDLIETWIEYFHRLKSGLFGVLVLVFSIWAWVKIPAGHLARHMAIWALIFTVLEALIGAVLVKYGWVDQNQSSARILMHGFHLMNTLLLLGSFMLFYVLSQFNDPVLRLPDGMHRWMSLLIFIGFLFIAMSGSWAALGNSLWPSVSLQSGIKADFDIDSPLLVRLRILHPLLSTGIAALMMWWSLRIKNWVPYQKIHWAKSFPWMVAGGVVLGVATLLSLSPTFLKILHLFWADLLWLNLVALASWAYFKDLQPKVMFAQYDEKEIQVWNPAR